MGEQKHTQLPWANGVIEDKQVIYEVGGFNGHITSMDDRNSFFNDETREANAEFIVRACNSHYDLIAALEWIADHAPTKEKAQQVAIQALAKSKGENQ